MAPSQFSRREFMKFGAAVVAGAPAGALAVEKKKAGPVCEEGGCCITQSGDFYNVERGNPLPYELPIEKQREIGMVRETWQLEVIADPESNSKIERPLLKANGTALTFERLMEIAKAKATSFFKVITCNNLADPLGHGLWEGVPLRDVLWLAGPVENLRHVYYYGHHNEDPKQIFKCYLPINRVFEDPPGELPVILCYKLNGEFLTGERGGPVRMIVPEAYGFKSVKWLQRIVFTNAHQSDDTYAKGNNDTNSWMKTFARFGKLPSTIKADEPLTIHGNAQVGVSGLTKVQYWLRRADEPLPEGDRYFTKAPWQDARISPFDPEAIKGFDHAKLNPVQFDPATKQPREWPLRDTLCRWTAKPRKLAAGSYELRCRTIDKGEHAQPMPRPFPKSGRNQIQIVKLEVVA
jgi:DMSO/TMAO reductase YedYZ molybdopterin-dependent catalytic subunit